MKVLHEHSIHVCWNLVHRAQTTFREVTPFEQRMFPAFVDPTPGMRALDVGCGFGEFSSTLAMWKARAGDGPTSPYERRSSTSASAEWNQRAAFAASPGQWKRSNTIRN